MAGAGQGGNNCQTVIPIAGCVSPVSMWHNILCLNCKILGKKFNIDFLLKNKRFEQKPL